MEETKRYKGVVRNCRTCKPGQSVLVGPLDSIEEVKSAIRKKIREDPLFTREPIVDRHKHPDLPENTQCAKLMYIIHDSDILKNRKIMEGVMKSVVDVGYVFEDPFFPEGLYLRSWGMLDGF